MKEAHHDPDDPNGDTVVRVSNRYRYRVTLHCRFDKEIRTLVSGLLIQCNTAKEYKGVSVFADYNPME